MQRDADTIRQAVEILEGPNAEQILREAMKDLEHLIALGLLTVDVAYTLQRLKDIPTEIWTADDLNRYFGGSSIARDIVKTAEGQK